MQLAQTSPTHSLHREKKDTQREIATAAYEKKVVADKKPARLNQMELMGSGPAPAETNPHFKRKSGGVIPVKRKLVKTLIFRYILQLCSGSAPNMATRPGRIYP